MTIDEIVVEQFMPVTKIEFPKRGRTSTLTSCFGIGFYHPERNSGYLYHTFPFWGIKPIKEALTNLEFDAPKSEYDIFAAGLKLARPYQKELREPDNADIIEASQSIERELPQILNEQGFDTRKLHARYNRQYGEDESSSIVIKTQLGYCEILLYGK